MTLDKCTWVEGGQKRVDILAFLPCCFSDFIFCAQLSSSFLPQSPQTPNSFFAELQLLASAPCVPLKLSSCSTSQKYIAGRSNSTQKGDKHYSNYPSPPFKQISLLLSIFQSARDSGGKPFCPPLPPHTTVFGTLREWIVKGGGHN